MSATGPPPGGDENRQGGILASNYVVLVIASVVVLLRMVTRIWIVRSVGWDDYTIIFATFGHIVGCGLVIVIVHYGFGRHKFYLTEWQYIEFEKYSYGEWIQTFQSLMFTKISICLFLLRIPVEKRFIRPLQVMIVTLVVSNIVLTLLWIFQCHPVSRAWNKQVQGACFTEGQLQRIIISQALVSIISDFMLALFLVVLLWNVQIALRIKAGLCVLMGLGLFTAACCIVRTIMNWQNVNSDPTWASIDNWYWRSWEVCIGIIAACIPAMRPGYRTISAAIISYISRRSSSRSTDKSLIKPDSTAEGFKVATQAASTEADHANAYGAGDEGFAMHYLPGDKKTLDQGIKKTTRIDVEETSGHASQRSLELGDVETGYGSRNFVQKMTWLLIEEAFVIRSQDSEA